MAANWPARTRPAVDLSLATNAIRGRGAGTALAGLVARGRASLGVVLLCLGGPTIRRNRAHRRGPLAALDAKLRTLRAARGRDRDATSRPCRRVATRAKVRH